MIKHASRIAAIEQSSVADASVRQDGHIDERGTMSVTKPDRLPKPTDAELNILNVLWDKGPSTVREVHEILYRDEGGGYTTALKLLQIMHAKGLVARDDSERAHVFRAAVSKERTQKRFLGEMVQRVFNGSAPQLVLQVLGGQPHATRAELGEIRALLDKLDASGS